MPLIQLGGVGIVLAFLPLLLASILGMRSEEEVAPVLLFIGLCASLAVYCWCSGGRPRPRSILDWSQDQFGESARKRYEALIVTAIRDAASRGDTLGATSRPELGEDVSSWHLARGRSRSSGGTVRRPRHFLVCRWDDDVLVIGRVLHDAMDLRRHLDPGEW